MGAIGRDVVVGGLGVYGAKADSRDVLLGGRYAVPTSARQFVSVLTTYSPPTKTR